ncbi:MAG: NAD-dependent deacylase [Saprospiraceae bacterium]|nr:NAD-dependent deacylase [Saprospiraceae bacterium]
MLVVVLSGSGISAESGVSTFRDANGIWQRYRIEDVATPEAWHNNREGVLDFYNQRRKQLFDVAPNPGHEALVELEKTFEVQIITQNVDDLHERAGSKQVMHLHGELRKVRCERCSHKIYDWPGDLQVGDTCDLGHQLRPHIVWFGEEVPMIGPATELCRKADALIIVGTSMQVYPAAGLVHYAPAGIPVYYVDPDPAPVAIPGLRVVAEKAGTGLWKVVEELKKFKV